MTAGQANEIISLLWLIVVLLGLIFAAISIHSIGQARRR